MNLSIKNTTAKKILNCARELFAKYGPDGTSIREIAKEADVNLAAINYHFKNKENLFQAVFEDCYAWMDQEIEIMSEEEGVTTEKMALGLHQLFMDNKAHLYNSFKVLISEQFKVPEGHPLNDPEQFGPPGEKYFLKVLKSELSQNVDEEDCRWAIKILISNVTHSALLYHSNLFQNEKITQFFGQELKAAYIQRLVKALLNEISAT